MGKEEQMNQTPKIDHQTSKIESPGDTASFGVGRSTFDVRRFLWRILDFIVAAVFLYAGVLKMLDPAQFAHDVNNYRILPWTLSVALGFYLPWLEIFCGLALIARFLYGGALSILTLLIVVFTLATIAAKARGLDITCGCFGHASQHWSLPAHLVTNSAILAALLALGLSNRLSKV